MASLRAVIAVSAGEDDMEGYENGQPHHAALPSAHSGAFPSPADYASLLHPDPTHTSQVTSNLSLQ